jgi:hypothetical protein
MAREMGVMIALRTITYIVLGNKTLFFSSIGLSAWAILQWQRLG